MLQKKKMLSGHLIPIPFSSSKETEVLIVTKDKMDHSYVST